MSEVAIALAQYAAGKTDAAGRVLAPVVTRLSRVAAWDFGRKELADDIAQELWLVMDKAAARYDPTLSPPEPYLLGWLRKISQTISRKNPVPMEALERDEDIHESMAVLACTEDSIDRKLAIDAIQQRMVQMSGTQLSPLPFVQAVTPAARDNEGEVENLLGKTGKRQPSKKTARQKNADHLRIREIRKDLDMTQAEFAAAIGLLTPTLVSYEQGQTRKVPPEVMERAEELMASDGREVLAWREKFDSMSMPQILDEWAAELGADPSDLPTMAALTGTVTSTVSRWRNEGCRPTLREIVAYDRNVKLNARRLKKSGLVIEGQQLVRE